jgi:hypothetical protein
MRQHMAAIECFDYLVIGQSCSRNLPASAMQDKICYLAWWKAIKAHDDRAAPQRRYQFTGW